MYRFSLISEDAILKIGNCKLFQSFKQWVCYFFKNLEMYWELLKIEKHSLNTCLNRGTSNWQHWSQNILSTLPPSYSTAFTFLTFLYTRVVPLKHGQRFVRVRITLYRNSVKTGVFSSSFCVNRAHTHLSS